MCNEKTKFLFVLYIMLTFFLAGCGSSVTVKRLGDNDAGIPYYLPRPYLLITKGISSTEYQDKITEIKTEEQNGTKTSQKITEQVPVRSGADIDGFSVKIIYLPDVRTKYGIKIKPGSGTSDTKITLNNGWQLTSLTSTTDTKIPETITAAAALVGAISPTGRKDLKLEGLRQDISVGIYEMVWDGSKVKFDTDNPVFEWPSPKKSK